MLRLWQIAIVAAVGTAVASLSYRLGRGSTAPQIVALDAEAARLRSELRRAAAPNPAGTASTGAPSRERAEVEQIATKLDAKLGKSMTDETLSKKLIADFRRIVGPKSSYEVVGADCGPHFCRLVAQATSRDSQRGLGYLLSGREPFNHGVLYRYDSENRTTLYVARAGADLLGLGRTD